MCRIFVFQVLVLLLECSQGGVCSQPYFQTGIFYTYSQKTPELNPSDWIYQADSAKIQTFQEIEENQLQQRGEGDSNIKFSGFLKYEIFFDTRQTVNVREGLVVLYPDKIEYDENGDDINAVNSINMLSIHSRLRSDFTGPRILNARTSGLIEADFYGNENQYFSDLNGLRLFNGFMKFDWSSTELLIGQFWHPMSLPEYLPRVISFNAGAPFHPVSRNPQIRIKQHFKDIIIIGALLSQRDFTGTGPEGPGSQYLRNSGIPNLHVQIQYEADSTIAIGGGIDFKKIIPEIQTSNQNGEIFKTSSNLKSISCMGFANINANNFSMRLQGIYAQNAYDILMLGGYAVQEIVNTQTGEKSFSNLNSFSIWGDLKTNGAKFTMGLFAGFTKNLGSSTSILGPLYSRGQNIRNVLRIAPRFIYALSPLVLAFETEYTAANYGFINGKGGVTNIDYVYNFRPLLSLKYSFGN